VRSVRDRCDWQGSHSLGRHGFESSIRAALFNNGMASELGAGAAIESRADQFRAEAAVLKKA